MRPLASRVLVSTTLVLAVASVGAQLTGNSPTSDLGLRSGDRAEAGAPATPPPSGAAAAAQQDVSVRPEDVTLGRKQYSPYLNRGYPQRVFFGDTHLHTAYSTDAGMIGCVLGPEERPTASHAAR